MTDTNNGGERGPITHEVKCWRGPFAFVKSGAKPWELRKNDRDYREGDTLRQYEWDEDACRYTGDQVEHVIGWSLYGPAFGLPADYVIMTLQPHPSQQAGTEGARKLIWAITHMREVLSRLQYSANAADFEESRLCGVRIADAALPPKTGEG